MQRRERGMHVFVELPRVLEKREVADVGLDPQTGSRD